MMKNNGKSSQELSRVAVAGNWGDLFRFGMASGWSLYLLILNYADMCMWLPMAIYAAFCLIIIFLRKKITNASISAFMTILIDVGFITYMIHHFGSHSSQITLYYLVILMGYHIVEPRPIRRTSLLVTILAYAAILVFERLEWIDYFLDGHIRASLPPMDRTISAFVKVTGALLGSYGLLSISSKKIEAYVLNEKKLLDEKKVAQEESRALQKQIEASQRLESLGRLAGGVAHDFNNLLTGILSYTQFLKEDLQEDKDCHRDVEAIISATQKASKLTAQLLTFGRKQIIRPHIISLNTIVNDTQEILRRSISENIKIVNQLCPDLGNIKADSSQVEQVIINLVVNARDAMPQGGTLTIETNNIEITPENFKTYPELSLGSHVMICVKDTGEGISPEHVDKIFDPFFTTKRMGEGTGLGLSTVYGIIRQNNGHIDVKSTIGEGSSFCCVFPRVFENLSIQTAPQPLVTGDKETILVTEDEDMVRASVTRILTRQNYNVLVAASGEEAIEVYHTCGRKIDLLLTDVIMTGMTGETLADKLHKNNPDLAVLFMSGYTEDAIVNRGILKEGTAFLAKPFSAEELMIAVSKTLRRSKKTKSKWNTNQ